MFGVSKANRGMIPGGIVAKPVVDIMPLRDALYCTTTGETFDGCKVSEMRLVNKAVAADRLREKTVAPTRQRMEKNARTLRAITHCMCCVRETDYFEVHHYLAATLAEMKHAAAGSGSEEAMKQPLDEKSYRPSFGAYSRGGKSA